MANGLLAALSPNEESTLRQIAHGAAHAKSLREGDVRRLKGLGLVEQGRTGLTLSLIGRQRLGASPSTAPLDSGKVHPSE